MALGRVAGKKLKLNLLSPFESSCQLILNANRNVGDYAGTSEYTNTPNYPPILKLDKQSVYTRDRDDKLGKIKRLGTIEEKLIGINMPRYYGWSSLVLKEGNFPFNILPFLQHITRTDLLQVEKLPYSNDLSQSEIDSIINKIRPQLQEAIILETSKKNYRHIIDGTAEALSEGELSDIITKGVVEQINRVLTACLVEHAPHLYETEIDFEPRIEAFWRVGGFYPNQETYNERKKDKETHIKELKQNRFAKRKIEEEPEDVVGHFIQYSGHPVLQLRCSKPLRPFSDNSLPQPDQSRVPVVKYDPGFYGLEKIRRHGTNVPGFWPGNLSEFGLLSYHSCGHLLGRPPHFGEEDVAHTVTAQAVLAGYAWLLAQANYQGFSTFHDVTYPLTTTTVVTDGRVFSFFASQLNTLLLHDEFIDINPKVNVCYGLPTCELYQKIDGNEIIGWNDKALQVLVEAYLNTPEERVGVDLKPFVDKDIPFVKDIKDEKRRVWQHDFYRNMVSNRPRHMPDPEIYDWESIYKIKFNTRHMDPRRRFFEVGVDPFKRRLNENIKRYFPKKLRDPENPKQKFYDTYFPDC